MSVQSIGPIQGVPEELIVILNTRFRELSSSTLATSSGSVAGLFFLHANRPDANGTPAGTFGTETDRTVTYQVQTVSSKQTWVYTGGTMAAVFASRPTDLGTNDAGFRFWASDTDQNYRWSGAAWVTLGLVLDNAMIIKQKSLAGTIRNLLTHFSDDIVYLDNDDGDVTIRPKAATGKLNSSRDVNVTGNVTASGVFKVGANQVVTARQANIPVVAVGGTTDANARATIASILGLLQAHGLMT